MKTELLEKIAEAVVEMEEDVVVELVKEYISQGHPALEGVTDGLIEGMNRASALFEAEEYFVTDMLLCSDAMYQGLELLEPHLEESKEKKVKCIIGVVEGDVHDIGKNLVKIMMETAGYEMIDLGRDVSAETFVNKAVEEDAALVCLSTLMTTTMDGMEDTVQKFQDKGLRNQFKIIIGGGAISEKYADEIGADGYSENAIEAVKLAKRLIG